jgi:phosphoribosylformylglycinamidine synthase
MNFAVLQFPASNCDQDALHAVKGVLGQSARFVWHKENSLAGFDAVIIPGGFSYGDYLRTGAIARYSPIMQAVRDFAAQGGPVLGICNGFQILCEAGMLPGALVRNRSLQFRCEHVFLKTAAPDTPFTGKIAAGKILRIPIAHGEGCYFADEAALENLQNNGQILWQYCDAQGELTERANPNGSLRNIAGVCNAARNVAGLMPHPERASEAILGSADGLLIFQSLLAWFENRMAKAA